MDNIFFLLLDTCITELRKGFCEGPVVRTKGEEAKEKKEKKKETKKEKRIQKNPKRKERN